MPIRAANAAPRTIKPATSSTRFSAPINAVSGPAASVPTNPPAMAALVTSGKRRFAWRASSAVAAIVQTTVSMIVFTTLIATPMTPKAMGAPLASVRRSTTSVAGKGKQQPDEERPPRQLSQPDAVPQRHDQAHATERDVQVRQVGGPEAAEEEGHVGDLAGPAGRLDGREQPGQEGDRPALARPDGEHPGSLHGLAGSGVSSAACSNM